MKLDYQKIYRDLYEKDPQYGSCDHSKICRNYISRIRPTPTSVLDVGCGDGKFLEWAQHIELRVGIDIASMPQVPGIIFVQDDARKLSQFWPERTFDLVTAFDVLEHFAEDDAATVLTEMFLVGKRLVVKPSYRESVAKGVNGENLHPIVAPPGWWHDFICSCLPNSGVEMVTHMGKFRFFSITH